MTESSDKSTHNKEKKIISKEFIEKVRAAANYCFNCNRCVNVCPLSYLGIFHPRDLINDLTFLPPEEVLEKHNIWYCLTCGECMEYCPMTKDNVGVNIPEIILELRSLATEYEPLQNQQLECHHGRLYSNLPYLMANDEIEIYNKIGFLDDTHLKITDKGEIAYFMGCLPFMNSVAPCSNACPAGVDVQGYVSLIGEGKFQEALDLIREKNPFPLVCGRICTQPCEDYCNRKEIDDPVAIRALKRFISDWELKNPNQSEIEPVKQTKEKVAIIGSGPAGLTAAYYLARMGYKPTVFEESSYKGGMLRAGIPKYRLPYDILDYEIEFIEKMGVEIKTNSPVGSNLTYDDLKNQGYKAFFLSVGLQDYRKMKIEGEDLNNVMGSLDFLKDRNILKKEFDFREKSVGVVGGGNAAIDSARTALRLGAKKVIDIYRRSEREMPALREEIETAKEEGVEFHFLTNPVKLYGDKEGNLIEVECIQMELGEPDESGRRSPVPIEGSEFKMNLDILILALGQIAELSSVRRAFQDKLEINRWGNIQADDITLETNVPGVFAGGDIIGGKGIAIKAIGNGYEAAVSIDRFLKGIDLRKNRVRKGDSKISPMPKKYAQAAFRQDMDMLPIEERIKIFDEVEIALSQDQAIQEASRCLSCNICCSTDQDLTAYSNACDESNIQHCHYGEHPNIHYRNLLDYLEIPKAVIGLLNQKDIIPVVLPEEKCCGHDSLWVGDINTFEKLAKYNVQLFKDAGVKTIIFSCAEGYYTWKYEYKKLFKGSSQFDFEIYHITEYILKENLLDGLKFPPREKIKITYHDACRLGRMSNIYDAPREILEKLPFIEFKEMENNKKDASCCGVAAYITCNEYSKVLQAQRINEAIDTGAEYLIVSCPKCLAHFNCYLNEHIELKNKLKVIDLTTFIGKMLWLL
ncbi:MAG: FAD-dependent oxidoreductase [Promethearchaeota archaeon]